MSKNHLLLLSMSFFNNKNICLQSCTDAGIHMQKATTFSRSPATTGRELQPPSFCTSRYVYLYVCTDLQKAMTFFLPLRTMFHKFSYWILLEHNTTIWRPCFIQFSYWTHQQHWSSKSITSAIQPSNTSALKNHWNSIINLRITHNWIPKGPSSPKQIAINQFEHS